MADRAAMKKTEVVALYARVSSDEQREQQTIRTQLEYARGRATLDGWTIREFIDDGVSGKKISLANRPAGAALLEAARRGEVSRVVTYRLDRLGRRARFIHEALEDLTAAGVAYQSLTEPFDTATPAGKLFLGVLAVMAEFESDSIAQRTNDGKRRVAAYDDRWLTGVVPYGYSVTDEHSLVIDPGEAGIVRQIYAWAIEGRPQRRIAEELNARGVPPHSDRPGKRKTVKLARWERPAISRILRSELYAGRTSYFRHSTTNEAIYRNMPAIVTPAVFLKAREAVAQSRKFGGAHRIHDYLLRSLVRCGRCGHTITGRGWSAAHGYYCHYCPKGDKAFVDEDRLLEILWRDVLEFLAHPDATMRAMARMASEVGETEDRAESELVSLAQRLRELDGQEEQLLELRLAKTISTALLEKKAQAITAERERIRMHMQAVRAERAAAARAAEETVTVRRLLGSLRDRAEQAGEDRARRAEIVRTVTKSIVVHAPGGQLRVHVTYAFGQSPTGAAGVAAVQSSGNTRRRGRGHPIASRGR